MEFQTFDSEGVEIAYIDSAPADPAANCILLIHGFASNIQTNWIDTSWVRTLSREGYRAVSYTHLTLPTKA